MSAYRQDCRKHARVLYRRRKYDDAAMPRHQVFDGGQNFQIALRVRTQTFQNLLRHVDCGRECIYIVLAQRKTCIGIERAEDRPRKILLVDQERSEEHTSTPVTNAHLVCRLLLEKKKKKTPHTNLIFII